MAGLGALGGSGLIAGKSLAVLGAGLLSGAVAGSALVATGTVQFGGGASSPASTGAGLQLVPCPDQGPVLGSIPRDQEVLVTARSADGAWLQLYWPAPGIERAWTKAGPLSLNGDASSLPVAECEAPAKPTARPTEEPTPAPEATPSPTPTAIPTAIPTTGPTAKPTSKPTPKPNAAPKLSGLTASTRTVSYDQAAYCAGDPKSVTFSIGASDSDGLASVTLFYRPPGAARYLTKPMIPSGGKYSATLNSTADNLKTAGQLSYFVVAKDKSASPKTTRTPPSGALAMTVKVCKNTGPKVTVKADSYNLETNPLGTGRCTRGYALGTGIQAQATDAQGVASVRLYFSGPGMSGTKSRAMNLDGSTWYSFINPKDDGITRTGTITWYVVAKDKKGATTKLAGKSIKVYRCDSPASFNNGSYTPKTLYLTRLIPIQIQGYGSDADGVKSFRLAWKIVDAQGTGKTLKSGSVSMTQPAGQTGWIATFNAAANWPGGVLVWQYVLLDKQANTYRSSWFGQISVIP